MGCVDSKYTEQQFKDALAFPSWCVFHPKISVSDINCVRESWRICMSTENPVFLDRQAKNMSNLTPLTLFYDTFYQLLFRLAPEVRPLFKRRISSQGKMLANVIKFIVANIEQEKERSFRDNLTHLAQVHNERGITADQFSIMGVVLIQSIRECIGEAFSEDMRIGWILIYSRMMEVIIPEVVSGRFPDHGTEKADEHRAIYAVDDSKSQHTPESVAGNTTKTRRPSQLSRSSKSHSNVMSLQAVPNVPMMTPQSLGISEGESPNMFNDASPQNNSGAKPSSRHPRGHDSDDEEGATTESELSVAHHSQSSVDLPGQVNANTDEPDAPPKSPLD